MEIKAILEKPYTENQRIDFIIENNHKKAFEIRENDVELQAWGYTQEEIEQQEKQRIYSLSMTRSDFFDGIIKAFSLDGETLLNVVLEVLENLSISETDKMIAINNYKNALHFYRSHPLFNMLSNVILPIGEELKIKITSEQWDKFFDETNKKNPDAYKELLESGEKENEII